MKKMITFIFKLNLVSEETQNNIEKAEEGSNSKKKMALWKKILIGVGGFILVIILLASWATADLNKVVEKEINLLRSGDYKGGYDLTSSAFQKETSFEGFKAFLDQYPILKNNASFSSDSSERKDGMGSVKGTLKTEDEVTSPIEVQLIQEGGKWLIYGIKLPSSNGANPEANSAQTNPSPGENLANGKADSNTGENSFSDEKLGFSLQFPKDWTKQQKDFQFMVSGPKDKDGNGPGILIQKIGTQIYDKNSTYKDMKDLIKKLTSVYKSQYKNVKISDQTDVTYTKGDGTVLKGVQYEISYEYQNVKYKDWQVVIPQNLEGSIIFTWEYISSESQYEKDLPVVNKIFESWKIQ